jgi:hypothetical protein
MDSFDRRLFLKRTSVAAAVATTATVAGVPGLKVLAADAHTAGQDKKKNFGGGNFGSPLFIRIDDFSGKIHLFKDDHEFEINDFGLANQMVRHSH